MATTSHGTGGQTFDGSKRSWPNEANIFIALILIIAIFELLGQVLPYMNGQSMLFDFNTNRDGTILNIARIKIMILLAVGSMFGVATTSFIAVFPAVAFAIGMADSYSGPIEGV